MANYHIFLIVLVCLVFSKVVESYSEMEQLLRHHLFYSYDKHSRPSKSTIVKLRVTVKHLEVMESSQTMVLDTWMTQEWNDIRMQWNPSQYGDVKKLTVPHKMMWKPDLGVLNSATGGGELSYVDSLMIVVHTGRILFVSSVRLQFSCLMDLTYWPHDTQNCTCVIASWLSDELAIVPMLMDDKPILEISASKTEDGVNLTRSEWNVLDTNISRNVKFHNCCDDPYITILMSVLVSRNAPAFEWTIKGPVVGLSILTLVLFMLPPAAGEKVIFGVLCLLLDLVYIAYTSFTISMAPNHTPLIVEIVCKQAMLVVASIVIGALSLNFARDPHTRGLPICIKRALILFSGCLCLQNYRDLAIRVYRRPYSHSVKSDDSEPRESSNGSVRMAEVCSYPAFEWLLLAAFVDRLCLVIYIIIFILNMYAFSAVL